MNNENKKVISIRLIYILPIIAMIIAIVLYATKNFSIKTEQIAKNSEQEERNVASINREEKIETTSRSEEISRGKENTQTENTSSKNESNTQGTSSSASGNNIVAYAKKYMGYKYVSGGSSPSTGFDCSGFTSYVYKQCGISISRSSSAQASNGTAVSKSNLQPGDLVIFNNRANTSIGHVGIYIGGNTFIHAGNSGTGVITTSLSDSYYQARYVTGRRIIN